jgi:hypothetical protein
VRQVVRINRAAISASRAASQRLESFRDPCTGTEPSPGYPAPRGLFTVLRALPNG